MAKTALLLHCVVFEVVLNKYKGRSLVAAATGQVAQTCKQVGKLSRRCALGVNITNKVGGFFRNNLFHCFNGLFSVEVGKFVVGNVLKFNFVGFAQKTVGASGAAHGIGKFPNSADGIFECAVAVNHNFYFSAGSAQNFRLKLSHELVRVLRKKFNAVFGSQVASQNAVLGVEQIFSGAVIDVKISSKLTTFFAPLAKSKALVRLRL